MSINFVINSQLYKDSIIGAYTLFWDSIRYRAKAVYPPPLCWCDGGLYASKEKGNRLPH